MLEDFRNASQQLRVALEHYLHICSSIQDLCRQNSMIYVVPSQDAGVFDQELGVVDSFMSKLKQAQIAIKFTGKHTFSGVSPISCLPPEILVRIFHIVRIIDHETVDSLPLVSPRWRSVALGSQSLWTQIHFAPDCHESSGFQLARARLYASRSGSLPLDFFFSVESVALGDDEDDSIHDSHDLHEKVCELIAPRARSLYLDYLDLNEYYDNGKAHVYAHAAISAFLSRCTPGLFTKFVLNSDLSGFITSTADGFPHYSVIRVDLQHTDLNRIFSPITVLHLTGTFPRWTSHAYYGLVDLRLYPSPDSYWDEPELSTISEARLVKILRASPGLRILHFGLQIVNQSENGIPVPRVCLSDLEVLQVSTVPEASFCEIEDFLRLIEPGSKPLQLVLRRDVLPDEEDEWSITETEAFFKRSNVTRLRLNGIPQLTFLLPSLPRLQVLVLSGWKNHPSISPTHSNLGDADSQVAYPQLDTFFILDWATSLDSLVALTQRFGPKTLALLNGCFYQNDSNEKVGVDTIKDKFLASLPDVRIICTYPNPAEHQDLLSDR